MNERTSKSRLIFLDSRKGFTLIEIMVVMTIIAIMFSLGALAMMSANRQNQVLAVAREFQSTVRQAANESITVSNATGTTISAKAWSVAITNGAGSYSLDSYYPASPMDPDTTSANLALSRKPIDLQNNITVTVSVGGTAYSNETLNLIFSSPFAKFNARKGTIDDLDPWDISANDEATYSSNGNPETGTATVKFSNGTPSMDVYVTIDLGTGETSI